MRPRATLAAVRVASQAARTAYTDQKAASMRRTGGRRVARHLAARPRDALDRVVRTMRAGHGSHADDGDERPRLKPTAPVRDSVPDVLLDVPALAIEEIDLELDDLSARVALGVDLLDLLKLNVGADAQLGSVKLAIRGVQARAQLQVRLDNVARIVDSTMATLDHHPEIVTDLAEGVGTTASAAANGALHALDKSSRRSEVPHA